VVWQKIYPAGTPGLAESIQETADGGYVVAGTTALMAMGKGDVWVLKLDSLGEIIWQRSYSGPGEDIGNDVRQTLDGGFVVAATTSSFGARRRALWMLRLKANGDVDWQKQYDHVEDVDDFAKAIRLTPDGGIVLASQTASKDGDLLLLKLQQDGGVQWQKSYAGKGIEEVSSIEVTSDGGYVVAGSTASPAGGQSDAWLLRLDVNGEVVWQRTFGQSSGERALSIQQTADGGYIAVGDASHPWVLKLTSGGDFGKCYLVGTVPTLVTAGTVVAQATSATVAETHATSQQTDMLGADCQVRQATMCPRNDPDLAVAIRGLPSAGCPGETIAVESVVSNSRPNVRPNYLSDPTIVRFVLSNDEFVDPGDRPLGERPVPYLPPEGTDTASTQLTIPEGVGPLSFIIAAVDPDNLVPEADETNNTDFKGIVSGSDLIVPSLNLSQRTVSFTISGSTENQGPCTAGRSATKFFWSASPNLGQDAIPLGSVSVSSLDAGQGKNFTYGGLRGLQVPPRLPVGTYYIVAEADGDGDIPELSETNNMKAAAIAVGPDLAVGGIVERSLPIAANLHEVSIQVQNLGNYDASAFVVTFYKDLAATPVPHQAGDFTCSFAGLAAGATTICHGRVGYEASGSHTAWVQVDAEQQVDETDERNNTKSTLIE
jgi:hypothetical protein